MNIPNCPTESELVVYADADAPPEQLAVIRGHLQTCPKCRAYVNTLEQLIADMAAPLPAAEFDVQAHADAVLARLGAAESAPRRLPSLLPWLGVFAAAAAVLLLLIPTRSTSPHDEWTARGAASPHSLERDVGVRFYALDAPGQRLTNGSRISRRAAWTAEVQNVGAETAHALLFLVDAASVVHWVAPAYSDPNSPPTSLAVSNSSQPQRLQSSVVFDDLAPGKARLVEVVTPKPVSVLQVDNLPPVELQLARLKARFPDAAVRELDIEITP